KNEPIHLSRYKLHDEDDLKRVLKEGLHAGGVSMFNLSNSSTSTGKEAEVTNYFKTFGIDVIDGFSYNEFNDTITSNQEMIQYNRDKYAPSVDNVAESEGDTKTDYTLQNGINTYQGFDEFTSFFANQEIVGCNMLKDNAKVRK